MNSEIEIKTERLVRMLSAEKLGGVLLNSQANFAWLTGGKSNGVNLSVEGGACYLFIRADGKKFVLANNIEMPRMLTEEISADEFEPIEFAWQTEKSAGNFVVETAESLLNDNENIASDLFLSSNIPTVENLIARCRYSLTDAEIARFRKLGKDAGNILGNVFATLKQGETELEIARKVKDSLAFYNIESVVTLVAADERIAKFRHPIPTENIWRNTLLIVVCAKREGLIASLSRIACIGKIPDELQRKTESVAHVFAKFLAATKIGASGAEIYKTASDAYTEKGFCGEIDKHHQGGATGYKTRDWVAHPKSAEIVQNNQAFAWNPSITGTKSEETVILINDEIQVITSTPDFPQVCVEIAGVEYFSPYILSL